MKVNPFAFGALVLALFLGTVLVAQTAGFWAVSGKVTSIGEKIAATGTNPDEIKGWMTLDEVSRAYGISREELTGQFSLPKDLDFTKQIKDLESDSFSPEKLRAWLKQRLTR